MLKRTHIKVADNVLEAIQKNIKWKINRNAYLLGSVAPDLNFVYPAHTIDKTLARFRKRILRVEESNSNLVKSFTLGVITHYICDYFCYAHNLNKTDPKHAIYERVMRKHVELHEHILNSQCESLNSQWEEIREHINESLSLNGENPELILTDLSKNGLDHIDYILEMVQTMHKKYISETKLLDIANWCKSTRKIELDLDYATFMCEKMSLLISNDIGKIGWSGLK